MQVDTMLKGNKGKKGDGKGALKGKKSKDKGPGKGPEERRKDVECHYCKKKGHVKKECRKRKADLEKAISSTQHALKALKASKRAKQRDWGSY